MKKIQPISLERFADLHRNNSNSQIEYYKFFQEKIDSIKDYAISTYIWILFNQAAKKIETVSENVEEFTPFKKIDWIHNMEDNFFLKIFHSDDVDYILGAFQIAEEMRLQLNDSQKGILKFNIYGRMIDKNNEYRLVMLKTIGQYINNKNEQEASLVVVYDMSQYNIANFPVMSLIVNNQKEIQYHKYIERGFKTIEFDVPKIRKREKEILSLMCKGYNTPQIALKLSISQHTVDNHKRNLRKKTNTKTSAELIAYIMIHNLI